MNCSKALDFHQVTSARTPAVEGPSLLPEAPCQANACTLHKHAITADVTHAHDRFAGEAALHIAEGDRTHSHRDMIHAIATFELTSDASVGSSG